MKKRVLAVMLTLSMLLSLMPMTVFAADTNTLDGTVDKSWYERNENDTSFTITTGAQLAGLAQLVNGGTTFSGKTVKLGADIDLNGSAENQWTPINGFAGTFDGGYEEDSTVKTYTISNLYVHSDEGSGQGFGLFGTSNGQVKNLTIHNAHVMGNAACGAFVGKGNGLLENLHLTGTIAIGTTTSQGHLANFNSSYIGGIRGYSFQGKIKNCTVTGNESSVIGGGRQVGGILGFDSYGNPESVDGCTVKDIKVLGGKSVGGVVGWANSTGIQNCGITNVRVELTSASEPNTIGLISGTSRCLINDTETTVYENNTVDAASKLIVNGETPSFDSDPVLRLYSPYSSESYVTLAEGKYMFTCYGITKAMTKGDHITLLASSSEEITIPAEKTLTIDLNTYKLEGDIINNGTLTLKNGTSVSNITNNGALTIQNGTVYGTVTGNEPTLENAAVIEPAAKTNSGYYPTVQAAIEAGKSSYISYIDLMKDCAEDLVFPALDSTINIYDNGYSLTGNITNNGILAFSTSTGTHSAVITNNGTLTLSKDANTGLTVNNNGVLNITGGNTYDLSKIHNAENGTVIISGGTFTSAPAADWIQVGYKAAANKDGNYGIVLMSDEEALAAGAVARYNTATSTSRKYYKTLQEGLSKGGMHLLCDVNEDVTKAGMIDLYCEEYTFTGSLICSGKTLRINNGTAILNKIECAMFNGGYSSNAATITVKDGTATAIKVAKNATVTIEGGTYTGPITVATGGNASLTISGGYFTSNPSPYVAEGKTVLPSDKAGYTYMVGEPTKVQGTDTEVAPAPETTPKADVDDITNEADKTAVQTAITSTTSNGLKDEAAAVAVNPTQVTVAHVNAGLSAAKTDLGVAPEADASAIKLVVQPYLDIEAKSYTATETEKTLNVEITPKYNLLATKSDTDVTALSTADGVNKNAVIVESNKDLPTDENTQVTINFQLPSGFITDDEQMDKVFVVHTKQDRSTETYKATVTKSGSVYTATFTTNGFSPFVFTVDTRSAQVQFKDKDGNSIGSPVPYLPTNVGDALPTTAAPDGQIFGGWQFADISGTYTTLTDALLTALDTKTDPITATPYFYTPSYGGGSGSSVTTYPVSASSNVKNGTVTVSPKNAAKGATVTITVKPDKGYELDSLTVTDKNGDQVKLTDKGNGKYTFTMPASKVDVKTSFVEAKTSSTNPFVDVSESAYYYDAVLWAVENGITGGTTATTFSPNASCTRAQAVTFLWRAAGSPAPKSSTMPFGDVAADAYYHDAVLWAMEQGITQGTTATAFSPNAVCTRGQIVTFLWRSEDSEAAGAVSAFTDVASNAYYAGAVDWAVENGITQGTTAATFSPAMNCTRAQIVTFLYRDYQGK